MREPLIQGRARWHANRWAERSTHRHGVFWRIIGWAILLFVLLWAGADAKAQEQYIRACQTSYACQLDSGVSWASGVRTYVFTPMAPDISMRIWVHNNNTSSAHTAQTLTVWITNSTIANASLINNSDVWVQAATADNVTAGARCSNINSNVIGTPGASGMGTCYASGMYAAQIAIQFTPGGTQAGSPDTFDIGIVQCSGVHCSYPSGPQPGIDETTGNAYSSIAGNNAAGNQLSASSICSGLPATCFPSFDMELLGASRQERAVSASGTPTSGVGVQSAQQFLSDGNTQTSSPAKSQSSANATSSSNATGTTLTGVQITTTPADWTVATQGSASACISQLAASATTRHCATGVEACLVATIAQTQLFVNFRDGATGAGTIKWNAVLADTAGIGSCVVHEFSGGPICGTINTAMTLELSAATGAGNGCTTTVKGYDTL